MTDDETTMVATPHVSPVHHTADPQPRGRSRFVALLVVGLLGLSSACGDDADDAGLAATGDDSPSLTPDAEPDADGEDGTTSTTSEAEPAVDGEDDGTTAFCAAFAPLNTEADAILSENPPDAAELRDLLGRFAELDPPDDLAADWELQLEAFWLYADMLDGDTEAEAELNERLQEFEAASERLEPFLRDVCDTDFGDLGD